MRKAVKNMMATRQGQLSMIVDAAGVVAVLIMAVGILHLPAL